MKKMSISLCVWVVAAMLLTGCSGLKEMNAALSEASHADEITNDGLNIMPNKTTKAQVFNKIGAPGLVCKNAQGGETWIYPRVAVRQSNVGFNARGNFAAIFPFSSDFLNGGGFAGVRAASDIDSRRSSYKSAGLMINFNTNGCVSGYKFTATSF